ncbi:hypothetical protein CCACVL1_03184 [Corchorus capsularis]|uniref:Uncharacterized protein n=1 Tax=Corchorus capsularis TaxID=210143 RepID=A0A1R3K1S9_COCAP|nr:hypothetical protein CCACVL1_03184 [Corchorus capsularis]
MANKMARQWHSKTLLPRACSSQ